MSRPQRLRATELYCTGNLFRHKAERLRKKYNRKAKHKNKNEDV
jgi:stalled ribosome alternative rescue factor ArfA